MGQQNKFSAVNKWNIAIMTEHNFNYVVAFGFET